MSSSRQFYKLSTVISLNDEKRNRITVNLNHILSIGDLYELKPYGKFSTIKMVNGDEYWIDEEQYNDLYYALNALNP